MSDASSDEECAFCRIVRREEEADIVYESERTLTFLPRKPAATGHVLVVPKVHVSDLWHVEQAVMAHVVEDAVLMARAIRLALNPDGINMINSAGAAASQSIFHLHVHLVPRWNGDAFGDIWPPSEPWTTSRRTAVANCIMQSVDQLG
ncbi:HIT family protein [Streptomyces parvulus]|uniref:HIT family protein n=1 Tax=Streptomyces parvulus TaxID=146923 RepID=UPI001CFBC4CE|nr:HIT family protein [Streptomyces parvulus]